MPHFVTPHRVEIHENAAFSPANPGTLLAPVGLDAAREIACAALSRMAILEENPS
jgi:hypothetical protein